MDSMHSPGASDSDGGYQPMQPGYSPPQKKGGFNWLACCGISCGVMLVLAIIAGFFIYSAAKKVMDSIGPVIEAATELESTSIEEIRAQAVTVDAEVAGASPETYSEQWLALEGEVMDPGEFVSTYYAGGGDTTNEIQSSASQEGTVYMLRGGIMLTDTSNSASVAGVGEYVRGYGKLVVIDLAAMPWVGPIIAQELGENSKFSFFVAKQVEAMDMEEVPEGLDDASTWDDAASAPDTGDVAPD
jgi:hypothetical protein